MSCAVASRQQQNRARSISPTMALGLCRPASGAFVRSAALGSGGFPVLSRSCGPVARRRPRWAAAAPSRCGRQRADQVGGRQAVVLCPVGFLSFIV